MCVVGGKSALWKVCPLYISNTSITDNSYYASNDSKNEEKIIDQIQAEEVVSKINCEQENKEESHHNNDE